MSSRKIWEAKSEVGAGFGLAGEGQGVSRLISCTCGARNDTTQ
jgi:hypothetical protein